MVTLIYVNTCEKLGFDAVIKGTYSGLKMQKKKKSSNFELNIFWSNYHFQIQHLLKGTNILAIILVPLIMTLSRGHTGQIKGTAILR